MIAAQGKKYGFEIVTQHEPPEFTFFIKARCKATGRFSYINNLNTILSEFHIEVDDPKVAESIWVVSKCEIGDFINIAKQSFSDSFFLDYLERRLDEDRTEGEWENVSTI